MNCPKCIGKLQKKDIEVNETSADGRSVNTYNLEIDQCFSCGGVWFDKGELEKYTKERLTIVDSPSVGKELDKELDLKEGNCPRCQIALKKKPYKKDSSITLDICEKCGGVWLDSTEIDRIEKLQSVGLLGSIVKLFKKDKN